MKILGVETSCDETSIAVLEAPLFRRENDFSPTDFKILSNIVSSQINIHKKYGGVVPEVAARKHVEQISAVLNEAFEQANIKNPHLPAQAGK